MLPRTYKKLVAVSLSSRFRDCVQVKCVETPEPGPDEVLIRNRYVGINASDINWTAGRYIPGMTPPFDTGFEGTGEVVAVGKNCDYIRMGAAVGFMKHGAFSEYIVVAAKHVIPLPALRPEFVSLLVSGATASISFDVMGNLKPGENVLVTAAAGGAGHFAVQLAKLAGCHVVGTCSSDAKVKFLKKLGCDRPINYKSENLAAVLKSEYPKGINVVFESVGGDVINTCIKNLAIGGRLIIIGYISSYQDSTFISNPTIPLYQILLQKSASLHGFFLNNHSKEIPFHVIKLAQLYQSNKLRACVDMGYQERPAENSFKGLESVFDAVDYLYSSQSIGKVVVDLQGQSKL